MARPEERAGKTVLITGTNSGIGLATLLETSRLGFRAVGSVRSETKASAVADAARDAGVTVETVLLDVTDAERCAEVVAELRPWAVVNNAGYSGVGAIEDVTDDEARDQLEAMVVAPMRLARLSLPYGSSTSARSSGERQRRSAGGTRRPSTRSRHCRTPFASRLPGTGSQSSSSSPAASRPASGRSSTATWRGGGRRRTSLGTSAPVS